MAIGKVQTNGEISLPIEIQQAVGIEPGDSISIDVTASGTVEIRPMPNVTFDDLLERYRIDGPIDDRADREAWQDVAARDVLGADEHG
jgi:bifunctional DNA-binding transcriptional regulator/antitoxin component of YhaV-PrlF toxin-antitoxin module